MKILTINVLCRKWSRLIFLASVAWVTFLVISFPFLLISQLVNLLFLSDPFPLTDQFGIYSSIDLSIHFPSFRYCFKHGGFLPKTPRYIYFIIASIITFHILFFPKEDNHPLCLPLPLLLIQPVIPTIGQYKSMLSHSAGQLAHQAICSIGLWTCLSAGPCQWLPICDSTSLSVICMICVLSALSVVLFLLG